MASLGPGRLLLDGVKLADELMRKLGRATRERIPHIHEGIRERINDSATNGKRHVLEETVADGIVPVGRNRADLVVLDADEAGQVDARIRVPGKITLARHHVLGRAAEAGLRRGRIIIHGLKGVREVLLMNETPKADGRLLKGLRNQDLVGVALGGKFSPYSVVCRAHLFVGIKSQKGNERI